jgi:hypothetical protein
MRRENFQLGNRRLRIGRARPFVRGNILVIPFFIEPTDIITLLQEFSGFRSEHNAPGGQTSCSEP